MKGLFKYAYTIRFTGGNLQGLCYEGERSGEFRFIPQAGAKGGGKGFGSPYVYEEVRILGPA